MLHRNTIAFGALGLLLAILGGCAQQNQNPTTNSPQVTPRSRAMMTGDVSGTTNATTKQGDLRAILAGQIRKAAESKNANTSPNQRGRQTAQRMPTNQKTTPTTGQPTVGATTNTNTTGTPSTANGHVVSIVRQKNTNTTTNTPRRN